MTAICRMLMLGPVFLALAGCDGDSLSLELTPPVPALAAPSLQRDRGTSEYLDRSAVKGPVEEAKGPTGVDIALEWSNKYAAVSEKMLEIQRENQKLADKNRELNSQVGALKADLAVASKELGDANEMLRQMSMDLEKWKGNVLGFRKEMRGAQQAQLNALIKILHLLGGEVPKTAASQADQAQLSRSEEPTGVPMQ